MTSTPPPAKRLRLSSETSTIAADIDTETALLTAPCSDIADDDLPCLTSSPTQDSSSPASTTTEDERDDATCLLERATNVLAVEAAALAFATNLYKTCSSARHEFAAAVKAVVDGQQRAGKILFCGVGKSAYIAQKLTATCKSLSIRASFLHACEAVHGDLGDVEEVSSDPMCPVASSVLTLSSATLSSSFRTAAGHQSCSIFFLTSRPRPGSSPSPLLATFLTAL